MLLRMPPVADSFYKCHWYLTQLKDHPRFAALLRDLHRERTMSSGQWRRLRDRRLASQLCFAAEHIPFYAECKKGTAPICAQHPLGRSGEWGLSPSCTRLHIYNDPQAALESFPILTREMVARNRETLARPSPPPSAAVYENATGGSTGTPLTFLQDARYQEVGDALLTYPRQWWGVPPYARTAFIWAQDRDIRNATWRERFYHWRRRQRWLNAFCMTARELAEFCRMLRSWRPPLLVGYASALDTLARFAESENFGDLRFKAIHSSAEVLWPEQRKRIERVFQSPVYNFYGSRKVNNLAAECPEGRRLHLISAWRYVEIVAQDGSPLRDGELGYICVTDLTNRTMPLVRYRNEDIASISPEPCPCGRPTPVLDRLVDRSSDIITTTRGEMVHGEFFTHLFYGRNDVRRFQVHQTSRDRLVVRYVPAAETAHAFVAGVVAKIRDKMGDGAACGPSRARRSPCRAAASAASPSPTSRRQ